MALSRLAADATALADHAHRFGGPPPPAIHDPSMTHLPPPCSEPLCGSFHWPKQHKVSAPKGTGAEEGLGEEKGTKTSEENRVLVDLPNVIFYPSINPPLKQVRLRPSWEDHFDWWNVPNAVHLVLQKPSERNLFLKLLNKDLVVVHNAEIQGLKLRPGMQLVAVRPKNGPQRVNPYQGGLEALQDKEVRGRLPLEVTLGTPVRGGMPILRKPKRPPSEILNVKRLDMVLAPPTPTGHEPNLDACVQHKSFAYEISWEDAQTVKKDPVAALIFQQKKEDVAEKAGVPWKDVVPEQMFVFDSKGNMYDSELANKVEKLKKDSYPLTYRYVPPKCESLDEWMAAYRTKPSIPPEPKQPEVEAEEGQEGAEQGAGTATTTAATTGTTGTTTTTEPAKSQAAAAANSPGPQPGTITAAATAPGSTTATPTATSNNNNNAAATPTNTNTTNATNTTNTNTTNTANTTNTPNATNTTTPKAAPTTAISQTPKLGQLGKLKLGALPGPWLGWKAHALTKLDELPRDKTSDPLEHLREEEGDGNCNENNNVNENDANVRNRRDTGDEEEEEEEEEEATTRNINGACIGKSTTTPTTTWQHRRQAWRCFL